MTANPGQSFFGKDLYITWVYSGGTVVMSTYQKSLTYTPSVQMEKSTSGNATSESYVAGIRDGAASVVCQMQKTDTTSPAAFLEGMAGTLTWGSEGTTASKPKVAIPALCKGIATALAFGSLTELKVDFQQNGDRTDSTW